MEFDQSLDNLQCPHTMGSGKGQRATHQENYRLWVGRETWIPKLTEISG